jgi:hypothetical protein
MSKAADSSEIWMSFLIVVVVTEDFFFFCFIICCPNRVYYIRGHCFFSCLGCCHLRVFFKFIILTYQSIPMLGESEKPTLKVFPGTLTSLTILPIINHNRGICFKSRFKTHFQKSNYLG